MNPSIDDDAPPLEHELVAQRIAVGVAGLIVGPDGSAVNHPSISQTTPSKVTTRRSFDWLTGGSRKICLSP